MDGSCKPGSGRSRGRWPVLVALVIGLWAVGSGELAAGGLFGANASGPRVITALGATSRRVLPHAASNRVEPDQVMAVLVDGPVYIHHPDQALWRRLEEGQVIGHGDTLRTGDHGYLALSYSTRNLVLVKPKSGLRLEMMPGAADSGRARWQVNCLRARVLISCDDSEDLEIDTPRATLRVVRGQTSLQTDDQGDILRCLDGACGIRLSGATSYQELAPSKEVTIAANGQESATQPIDRQVELFSFRRFASVIDRFARHQTRLAAPPHQFKLDQLQVNGRFLAHLALDENGFRVFDPGDAAVPRQLLLRCKLTPYPRPQDRFELRCGTELTWPLQEAGDGWFQALIALPAFPELHLRVLAIDDLGRSQLLHEARLLLSNKRRKIDEARRFLRELELIFARRDWQGLRERIAFTYRDSFGNTYQDFHRSLETSLRGYRDVRLVLRPHRFSFKGPRLEIECSHLLSAVAPDLFGRYESRGGELLTLVQEDGKWKLQRRSGGTWFSRLQFAYDLRRGILTGRVASELDGTPVRGAQVRLLRTDYRAITDSLGQYLIANLTPGRYDIEVSKAGFGTVTLTNVEVRESGTRF